MILVSVYAKSFAKKLKRVVLAAHAAGQDKDVRPALSEEEI